MHTRGQKLNVNESDCEGRQGGQADWGENKRAPASTEAAAPGEYGRESRDIYARAAR